MRRDFLPLQDDLKHLDSSGYTWEAVKDNGHWIIVHGFPVPTGYNVSSVSIAIRIESGYPEAQLDMAYFNPSLSLASGAVPKATDATQVIVGTAWQRWSRHRTDANPWRPGEDNLGTHLAAALHWLEREVRP